MPEQQNPSSSSSPHSGVLWVNSQHSWRENTKNSREKHNWSWANRYLQHTALCSSLVQSWGVNGPSDWCFLRVLKIWRKLKDCKNAWFLEAVTEGKLRRAQVTLLLTGNVIETGGICGSCIPQSVLFARLELPSWSRGKPAFGYSSHRGAF